MPSGEDSPPCYVDVAAKSQGLKKRHSTAAAATPVCTEIAEKTCCCARAEADSQELSQAGDPRTAGNSSTYNEYGVRVHGCGKKQSPRGAQSDGRRTKTLNTLSRKYLWCTHEPVPRSSCSPTSYPQCGGRLPVIALGIPPLAGHFNMFSQQLRSAKEEQRRGTHSNFTPNFTDSRRYIHIHMHHLS